MIRIRRIKSHLPFSRTYEIELSPHGWPDMAQRHITRVPNSILEPVLGVGDAWSFVREADVNGRGAIGVGLLNLRRDWETELPQKQERQRSRRLLVSRPRRPTR